MVNHNKDILRLKKKSEPAYKKREFMSLGNLDCFLSGCIDRHPVI